MPMDLSLAAIGLNTQQNVLAQILGGAEFVSDMLYTAVPRVAAAGTTATFTRATTGSVQDHEGVLRTAIAGEARFTGARRVRNLLLSSESFATGWQAPGGCSVSANAILSPIGTLTADALIEDGTTAFHRINHASVTRTSGQVIAVSVYAKYAGRNLFMNWNSFCNATGAFNLQTGEVTQGAGVASIEALDDGWYRCTVIGTCTTTGADNGYLQLTPTNVSGSYAGDGVSGAYFWGVQLEDITGRADQTTPSEYVSVGVTSAPYYHGSMVDGVKCFPTDLSGNPIPSTTLLGYSAEGARTNLCLQSNAFTTTWTDIFGSCAATQNVIGPDGATSAWTLTDDNAAGTEGKIQTITLTAAAYTLSVKIKKTTGAQGNYPVIYAYTGAATPIALATIDTSNGVATAWTSFTGSAIASGVSARCRSFNTDYWLAELTFTATAAVWTVGLIPATTSVATYAGPNFTSALTGSAVFYGAQVELGSFATSYIPTTTVAVTRNADVLTYSSAGNIDGTKGAAYAEWTFPRAVNTTASWRIVSSGAASVPLYLANSASGGLCLFDGEVRVGPTPTYPVTSNTKSASTWGGGASIIANAGTVVSTAFDGDMNIGATIDVGCINGIGGFELNGNIKNVRIWQRALSSSELQVITQ